MIGFWTWSWSKAARAETEANSELVQWQMHRANEHIRQGAASSQWLHPASYSLHLQLMISSDDGHDRVPQLTREVLLNHCIKLHVSFFLNIWL
jgi:hypothetical protein